MSNNAIEALYIFDEHNNPILQHTYRSRPPSAKTILPLYLAHPSPRPSLIYLPNASPPTTLFSIVHSNLLFLSPTTTDTEPLFVLEFLHRVTDVLEEFLGAPLLSDKIESSYDVVAQLLEEMCDGGEVCSTEPDALRDHVEVPGWVGKLLGGVGLPSSSPSLNSRNSLKQSTLALTPQPPLPTIPWRRAAVRHTSNELYVDIVETLSVILAPSGRPLSAIAAGSIAFTSKISGVPDLLLTLTAPGGRLAIGRALDLPVFHPCVRLARWRERPGDLSFVPPDGRFVLAGYEVDLISSSSESTTASTPTNLHLPATLTLSTSLGAAGTEFEARLSLLSSFPAFHPIVTRTSSSPFPLSTGGSSSTNSGTTNAPSISPITISIPLPPSVRAVNALRASRGEAHWTPGDTAIEWKVETRDVLGLGGKGGTTTLRGTVAGPVPESSDLGGVGDETSETKTNLIALNGFSNQQGEEIPYQSSFCTPLPSRTSTSTQPESESRDPKLVFLNRTLMPTSASMSYDVKGWLASGLRVESLVVDPRRSRGLGEGVKPYKGVKYLTVSRGGVEVRG